MPYGGSHNTVSVGQTLAYWVRTSIDLPVLRCHGVCCEGFLIKIDCGDLDPQRVFSRGPNLYHARRRLPRRTPEAVMPSDGRIQGTLWPSSECLILAQSVCASTTLQGIPPRVISNLHPYCTSPGGSCQAQVTDNPRLNCTAVQSTIMRYKPAAPFEPCPSPSPQTPVVCPAGLP